MQQVLLQVTKGSAISSNAYWEDVISVLKREIAALVSKFGAAEKQIGVLEQTLATERSSHQQAVILLKSHQVDAEQKWSQERREFENIREELRKTCSGDVDAAMNRAEKVLLLVCMQQQC